MAFWRTILYYWYKLTFLNFNDFLNGKLWWFSTKIQLEYCELFKINGAETYGRWCSYWESCIAGIFFSLFLNFSDFQIWKLCSFFFYELQWEYYNVLWLYYLFQLSFAEEADFQIARGETFVCFRNVLMLLCPKGISILSLSVECNWLWNCWYNHIFCFWIIVVIISGLMENG